MQGLNGASAVSGELIGRRHRSRLGVAALILSMLAALCGTLLLEAAPARSDSAPQNPASPETPPTVAVDALPTVQINGVVWAQTMIGNRVYAGGSFSNARPAGSPSGSNTVARANMLAYDVVTGALVTTWAPTFNGQVRALAVSPDKSRLYVGGEFTTVNGISHRRIAAFDTATGNLIAGFNPPMNYDVNAIVATNTTVYAGGSFQGVGSQDRWGLAALNASNGALLAWAPAATGGEVWAMTINPSGTRIAVGGSFTAMNGSSNPGYGLAMVDAATGLNLPFAINNSVRNGTADGAITTLTSDADYVYGGGYTYGRAGGTFEGVFSASWTDGTPRWINDCHGDSYSLHAQGDVVYSASHTHYCENIDGIRQGDGGVGDYPYFRGLAMGKAPTGTVTWEPDQGRYYSFAGNPRSSVLTWYPSFNTGTYTGQAQGPWSVTGNADYLAMGGEFTRINGQNQQGLVRFAKPSIAPNNAGPTLFNATYPLNVTSTSTGKVRINWTTNEDIDNDYLTYRLYRDDQNAAGLIHTRSVRARSWNHFGMGFTDTGVAPGTTHRYRVVATDPFGNVANSPWTNVTVAASGAESAYDKAVENSEPTHWWHLEDAAGGTLADSAGFRPITTSATGVTRGVTGAIASDPTNQAARFDGLSLTRAYTTTIDSPPDEFTLEGWFRTTSLLGGKLIGRGNRTTSNSSKMDRQIYVTNSGQVVFGVKPDQNRQVVTSPGTYRDGSWHYVAASLSPAGMRLYVDGALVGQRADVTTAEHLARGYWRLGGDSLSNWPSAPSTSAFNGDLDEFAIYKRTLSATEIAAHHAAGIGVAPPNAAPEASFTATTSDLTADVASTSTDSDGTIASQSWDFGDGTAPVTTPTASHTYAAAGTYDVTLTVTDDDGASDTATQQVQVQDPPVGPQPLANDAFAREVTGGWGSADLGGAWTRTGSATNFSVADGRGRIRMGAAGSGPAMSLSGAPSTDTDMRVKLGADKAATGGGIYLTAVPRQLADGSGYFADVRLLSTGAATLTLGRNVSGTETGLATASLPGLTVAPGDLLEVRVQATGTAPATLRAKVWAAGQPEPAAWSASVTDGTASLQAPGGIGLQTYLSGSATNAPVTGLFDDLSVMTTQ